MTQPVLVAIMGPTASGKTALAIEVAKHFRTEILSADSRQMFREMSIGTAKPGPEEIAAVPHHFIDNLSITTAYNAGQFEKDALKVLESLFRTKSLAVVTGGSTLYFKTLMEGIDDLPSVSQPIRDKICREYQEKGLAYIRERLRLTDPVYYSEVDIHNPARIIRALEVTEASGRPYSSFLLKNKKSRNFRVIKTGITPPRQELYDRIDLRCDQMLENGLLEEVKRLYPFKNLPALQTVGYTEFFAYLDGELTLEKAISLFKQHTRNYAKRQLTWFRRDPEIQWFHPQQTTEIINYINTQLHSAG